MKKRYIVALVIILGLLGLLLFLNGENTIHEINADRIRLTSDFNELESESDLIIKAMVLPEKQTFTDKMEDGTVVFGYTITRLKVEEVFSGNTEKDDIIVITEEYFKLGKEVFVQGNYIPAIENNTYVFFLKKYDESTRYEGMYFPVDLEKGKYLIKNKEFSADMIDDLSNSEMEIGKKENKEYKEWYKEVIRKYQNK